MMDSRQRADLDRHITGGRYSEERIVVTCRVPTCGAATPVLVQTEYGGSEWTPAECGTCGVEFDGDEQQADDERDDEAGLDFMEDAFGGEQP